MAMTDGRSDTAILCALGALSGAVAWALISSAGESGLPLAWSFFDGAVELSPLSLLPGLVFGVIIGALLHRRGKASRSTHVWYVIAAGFAYFCAVHVAVRIPMYFPDALNFGESSDLIVSGIFAGLAGSFLLGAFTMRLLNAPGRLLLWVPLLVGTAAGALLGLTKHDHSRWGWTFLAFFVLWQGAYAASLAPLLRALPDTAR
jgi:hypothetical protein